MDNNFLSKMDAALSRLKKGMLASGRDDLLKAFQDCKDPLSRVLGAYNLGAVFWATIGDGENARKFYRLLVEGAEAFGIAKVEKALPSIVANACENLMHLSLTYEEYFEWSEKLRRLDPSDDVLRGMVPDIREAQEKGIPWAQMLESVAYLCYDRNDPKLDRGEYARAVSTFDLLLRNRKSMRLSREAWGRIIYEYGTLALRIASDASHKIRHSRQPLVVTEFIFVVQNAKQSVDEYLATNPSDEKVKFLQDNMSGFINTGSKADDPAEIVAMLNNEGTSMLGHREFQAALAKFEEAERISREIGDEEKLQTCIGNIALVAANTGDPNRALELLDQKEAICRKIGSHRGLAYTFINKASILQRLGRTREALALAEASNKLCEQYELDDLMRQANSFLENIRSEPEEFDRGTRNWFSKLLKK